MEIAILGNCQIEPLGLCLQVLAPDLKVILQRITLDSLAFDDEEVNRLRVSDAVLSIERKLSEFIDSKASDTLINSNFVEVPSVLFDGFHPDLVYARNGERWLKNGLKGDWNSGLLIWAFQNNYTVDEFLSLIADPEVYNLLGLTQRWDYACKFLEDQFQSRGFDFTRWLQIVRRREAFMWGINHPKLFAVCALAIQILDRLDVEPSRSMDEALGLMSDPLAHVVWPIHTPIAEALGVPAIDSVRQADKIVDMKEFANYCFQEWDDLRGTSSKIEIVGSRTDYSVLQRRARR